jgi:hypothetical protein
MEYALTDGEDLIIDGYRICRVLVEAFATPAHPDLGTDVRRVFLLIAPSLLGLCPSRRPRACSLPNGETVIQSGGERAQRPT